MAVAIDCVDGEVREEERGRVAYDGRPWEGTRHRAAWAARGTSGLGVGVRGRGGATLSGGVDGDGRRRPGGRNSRVAFGIGEDNLGGRLWEERGIVGEGSGKSSVSDMGGGGGASKVRFGLRRWRRGRRRFRVGASEGSLNSCVKKGWMTALCRVMDWAEMSQESAVG